MLWWYCRLRRTLGKRPSELPLAIDSNSELATRLSRVSRLKRRAFGVVVSWHRQADALCTHNVSTVSSQRVLLMRLSRTFGPFHVWHTEGFSAHRAQYCWQPLTRGICCHCVPVFKFGRQEWQGVQRYPQRSVLPSVSCACKYPGVCVLLVLAKPALYERLPSKLRMFLLYDQNPTRDKFWSRAPLIMSNSSLAVSKRTLLTLSLPCKCACLSAILCWL